ncbi:MAG: bifunctional metallophosphatase/5'-nucleotidase [Deltaproteobacteria bacterium]|nr:MAG: bifunctional metallophosphatase/5'-nucleotidase [Deltaproteobacteria bacterium]
MKDTRQKENAVFALDTGDLLFRKYSKAYSAEDQERAIQRAHLIVKSLNMIGYDAVGIGDDDLSLGIDFLLKISRETKVPFLSSNLVDEKSDKLLFPPYLIKEVRGFRVGMFSLLSPEVFLGQADERKKGITLRNPIETARNMVAELKPKSDLIILLSHLSYPKDVQLAQTVPGIHIIAGGHSGIHLAHPPVLQNTIIVQTSGKGMYGGRLELTLFRSQIEIYNISAKRSLERNLLNLKNRLAMRYLSETEKAQLKRSKEDIEQKLAQFKGKNFFINTLSPLDAQIKDDPEIKKIVDEYKSKFPDKGPPLLHDSRGNYTPKAQ